MSGRVLTSDGGGLGNARVVLTDSYGVSFWATSSSFGYYRIDGVAAGHTYFIGVASKRYAFTGRVLTVADELSDVDFVALP